MTQDMFNKIITSSLLFYTMVMFSLSRVSGKTIDLNGYLILVAPLITHGIHLMSNKIEDKGGSNGHGGSTE